MPQFSLEEQFLAEERERLKREQEQRRAARAAASIAQPANPQRTAEANKLARQVGQPPEYVEQNLDAVKQQQRAAAARKAAASNPTLGAWMEYARNGALAQDDVGVLESIGDTVAGWLRNSGASRDIYENARRGVFASDASSEDGFFDRMGSLIERGGAAVDEGIYNFIAGTTGSTVAREAAQTLSGGTTSRKVAGQTDWEAVKNKPSLSNIGGYIIDAGAESLPAMTALAVPVAGIGVIGVSQTGNIAAERARNNGRDEITGRDIGLSLGFGFGTAALDRLGFKGIFGAPAATVRGRIGRAAATEGTTEFLQSGLEYTGGSIGTDVGFDPMTALDQSIAGAVAGYGLGGGIRSTIEVARSARSIEAVDRLMTRSAESQVRQRDPDSFRNLIEQLTGSASDGNIYVSGEVIAQFNQDYAEDEFWGQFAEEIDDARLTGGDVAIPLSSAAAELSGKPDWEAIRGDVRAAPGAMTANEIAAAEAEWETIRKEAGEALDTQEREARAAAAPGERLRASIRETLMTRGMDPDQAAANAEVTAALFETEAANLGYDLTGREFEKAVSVQRVLPGMVADPEAADTLDVIVNAMRGNGEAEIGVGPTLMEFIRDRGGINDPGGDLRSMGVSPRLIRDFDPNQGAFGGISGAGDYGIDTVMRAAVEAGYFPDLAATGSNELDTQRMLDAIGAELAGSPVYSETRLDQMRQAGAELRELLAGAGVDPDTASMDEIRAAVERFDGGRSLEQSLPETIEIDGVERSTLNSEGQPLARDEEGVRAFWRWFGDSKVVDADGRPLVVYHGTGEQFEAFDPDRSIGGQFWFTTDRAAIERGEVGAARRGVIVEAYLAIQKPADWSAYDRLTIDEMVQREGMDGMALVESDATTYVAFSPTQIKSVNNRGTFSPDDARILYQEAPGPEGSEAFRAWAGTDAPVIEPDEINDFDFNGEGPFVVRGYHGTTHEFEAFNASVRGNKEGQFGAVNYFSSSKADASGNYGADGTDLTSRIEQSAERRVWEIEERFESEGRKETLQALYDQTGALRFVSAKVADMDDADAAFDAARTLAELELKGGQERTLEVFIRTEKPFVVGDENSPFIEFTDFEAVERQAIERVAENNGVTVEEVEANREDYEDEIDDTRWQIEDETPNALLEAVQTVADRYDLDAQEIYGDLAETVAVDGTKHNRLEDILRQTESISLAEDPETGDLIGYHVLAEIIEELGFDSIIMKNADVRFRNMGIEPGTAHIHVFDKHNSNIKSVENQGTFDRNDPRILYQKQRFYSALERAVEETKTNRAPAQQWLATLRKTAGVKAEELEWSGLEEWLEIQEGPVEKAAVLQVVRDGGIKVEEVVLGGDITERLGDYYQNSEGDYYVEDEGDGDFVVRDKDGNFVERYDNEYQAEEHASLWNDETAAKQSEPKFKDWSTNPESESYRELLITLPVGQGNNPDRAPSTHWDQPAVVAHTRFMEKRGPDGERILFVEEVQSDWHQKGRDQGYAVPAELDAARERYKKASDAWQAAYAEAVAMGVPSDSTSPMQDLINLNTPEADALAEKMSSLGLRLQEAQIAKDNVEKGGIPDAPFKSTWPALVMKRVISWAAENGYDQVAWTTGEQQAERYSLSKSVGSILAVRQDDGRYLVETGNPDAMEVLFSNSMAETEPNSFHKGLMTAEQLKEAFGSNIAEQLIDGADASFEAWAEGDRLGDDVLVARLEGRDEEADAMAARIVELNETLPSQRGFRLEGEENLRVGGEGMKAFYDRNLGNITNKIIKKYGVKVEPKVVEGMGALNNRLKATREDIQRVAGISAYGIKTVADAEARIRKYDEVLNDPQEGPRVKEETRAAKARLTTALPMIAKAEKLSAEPMEPTNLGFDITAEMRADVLESGFALFQRGQGPQGSIQFDNDGQALIRLFESANASTFQHEMAHFWLERMFANARQAIDTDGNPAARQTFADVEAIKAWFKDNGHPVEGDTIPTEAHEMFARAWEQYLMEGKAPTTRLQSAFRKFSRWLKMIYRTVANLNTPITPEIREVMDRMLATEQQIAEAAEARAAYLQFDNAIEAGMSEADARRYAELSEQVRSEAEEQLTGKVMRSIRAQGQKQWKEQEKVVRAEVEEMVDNRPPFAALKLLRQKDGPRLDKAWLQENFGEDVFGILPAGMPVHKVGGINPDTLAELVGFSSGDQLVRELIGIEARRRSMKEGGDKRPVREAIIAQEVKAEMNRRFGDPLADGTIEREASAAVQNDRLGEKVELELKALASKAGRKPTPYRMAREWARDRIQRGVIADMISGSAQYRYTRTAAKAARDAQSAILAGDMEAAFRHKQTELLHNALAREAAEASEQVDVAVRRLGKYAKQTKAKTLPLDYLDRIHTLLEGVEFKKVSQRGLDKRKALRDWIASEEAEGRTVELPERVLDEVDQKNWSRLTVEELMLLKEAVDQIAALGRLKTKLLTAKKDREVEAAATAMEQAIIASKKGPKPNRTRETLGYRAAMAFKSFKAMHRKMASLAREMDSVQDGGPVWDNLIRPMMERFDQEAEMNREATEKLLDILSPFYGRDSLGRPKMGGKGIYFESIGQSFNLEERMAIVGQMGNAGNLQRLIDGERGEFGFRWSMEQLNEIKASLTKEQMDAVQAIWDLFESYRPLIAAKERRVSGVEPEWVEPVPVETEHGTYKGGYWPIKYDPARSTEAQKQADAAEAERQLRGAFTAATTQRSFTKQRAERVTHRPLLYSFSGVTQGLTDVVHDLAFHEYLIDANRLLRHPKVSSAMLNYYGPEIMQQFRKGIEDVAAGATPAQNVWEQGVNHVRMGATVAGLGWNLKTALLQPFGLTQSIVRVGAPWILKGATQFFGSPIDTSRAVYQKSRFMRERSNTMQREISEIRNRIRGGTKGGEFINASFFFMITRTQLAIDLPTWQGAYEKAIAEGNEETLAVSLADQAVRDAQGGGQIGDLAAIQRGGPLQKLFTNFYSFFNTTYNLTAESWARTDFRKPGDVMALALDYLLLYSLPAAMGYFLEMAFAGEDDDDDRSLLEGLASAHISYMTGTMVGLRELDAPIQNLAEAATGAELNEYDFGYTGPAGLRFFADGTRAAQQAAQGEFDDALRKSMINTGGILFHLPSGQINKTWDGAAAIANDDTDNPMALVSGN